MLGQLQDEQNQVSQQLNSVASSLAATQAGGASAAGGTLVVQKATVQPMSKYGLPIEAGIIGFLIGLLGGAVFVLVRAQRGSRLRFRDEIARVAGAPVLASLEAPGCTTASEWRELLEGAPRASDEWALRHLRYAVQNGAGPRSAVRVISFAGDSSALTTGPRLALQAAANGIRTCLARGRPELDLVARSVTGSVHRRRGGRCRGSRSLSAGPVTAALRYNCWSRSSCSTESVDASPF